MRKVLLICCLSVLMFSGVANAAISSDLYGTYTGTTTFTSLTGSETMDMTIVIGADENQLSLAKAGLYLWIPVGDDEWKSEWNDSEGDVNVYQGESTGDYSFTVTNSGTSWTVLLNFSLSGDTLSVSGVDSEAEGLAATYNLVSGSFTKATPLPGAAWLLGSGLVGLVGLRRKHKAVRA